MGFGEEKRSLPDSDLEQFQTEFWGQFLEQVFPRFVALSY
jgi:hypothetical protein